MKESEYLEEFRSEIENQKSINTVSAYVSDLRQFFEFINKDFDLIKTEDIDNYKSLLLSQNMKPKTINRKLVSIRRFIDFLNNNTPVKVLSEVRMIKIQRQDYLEEILSKADFDRLVKAAVQNKDKRALAIFFILYLTGGRVSEILQLKIGDINSETKTVQGKGKKYRYLFFPDILKDYLADYTTGRNASADDYLFINTRNTNPMDRQSVHKLIKKYAGICKIKLSKAHAHSFRHLYCFRLIEEGLTLEEVADLAGHTDINTTRIYTRKTKPELMKAVKRLH
jgi:integrase/recombinase XerD